MIFCSDASGARFLKDAPTVPKRLYNISGNSIYRSSGWFDKLTTNGGSPNFRSS